MLVNGLKNLATAVKNPALGGGSSLRHFEISEILQELASVAERQDGVRAGKLCDLIEKMAQEGKGMPVGGLEVALSMEPEVEAVEESTETSEEPEGDDPDAEPEIE